MLYIYKILVVNWLVVLKICEDLITLYTGFIDLTIRPRASMLFKVAFPPPNNTYHSHLYRPSRTFKLRFGGVSREFGRDMVCILVKHSRVKIPMVRKFSIMVINSDRRYTEWPARKIIQVTNLSTNTDKWGKKFKFVSIC